jgi:beta-lactam-binding protein with PASTA domain
MRKSLCVAALAVLALTACKPENLSGNVTSTDSVPASAAPAKEWTMPNMVGKGLQEAQDAMQKLTGDPVFLTRSHDATSAKRQQLVDHNWKVCSQTPAAGTKINMKSEVDFGAVKTTESCP